MRPTATILHLDLDAFFAAVEQRDKPSLRGRPVVVGGTGLRGVVATCSYEARAAGVRSAMPIGEARRRCPSAAYLGGRFAAYRATSELVMGVLGEVSPLVEPLSLDEAFVDLTVAASAGRWADREPPKDLDEAIAFAAALKDVVREVSGVPCSVGLASSKLVAKVATDLGKPDGLLAVPPGTEVDFLSTLPVRVLPGVGPRTGERLARLGVATVADLQGLSLGELRRELGQAAGAGLHALARAEDDRAVVAEHEAKSISAEDTFERDLTRRTDLAAAAERTARHVGRRLRGAGLSARTVVLKVRSSDFRTVTRSRTLPAPVDTDAALTGAARSLLEAVDVTGGVRLLGVGVSGLTTLTQDVLFETDAASCASDVVETGVDDDPARPVDRATPQGPGRRVPPPGTWPRGADVVHTTHGPGWVWGSGKGRVSVRFETADSGPGRVRTFSTEDPALRLTPPRPWPPAPIPADPS